MLPTPGGLADLSASALADIPRSTTDRSNKMADEGQNASGVPMAGGGEWLTRGE